MKTKMSKCYVSFQRLIQLLGILALIGTLALAVWLYRLGILNDSNALRDFIQRHQFWGPLIFVLVQIFQAIFPVIPGGVTTVAGFLIFGLWLGFLYDYLGIIIGSIILFLLVRIYGRKFILLFVNEKTFYKYEARLEIKGFEALFILCMLSPISPADVLVMITGLTCIFLRRLILTIMLVKPISIISYSYIWISGGDLIKMVLH